MENEKTPLLESFSDRENNNYYYPIGRFFLNFRQDRSLEPAEAVLHQGLADGRVPQPRAASPPDKHELLASFEYIGQLQ